MLDKLFILVIDFYRYSIPLIVIVNGTVILILIWSSINCYRC